MSELSISQTRPIEISDEDLFWARCEHDRWFAGEHLARVVDQMSPNPMPIPLIARPEQRELWHTIDSLHAQGKRADVIMLKARAVGGSLGTMWGYYHEAMFTPHLRLLTLAHLDQSVVPLVEYAEGFIGYNDDLDADLRKHLSLKYQDEAYRFHNGSRWRFGTARSPNQLKSDRATRVLLTEMASYGGNSEDTERRFYEALDGAIPNHSNVTIVRESTSSGPRGRFYKMFMDAMAGTNDVKWLFFSFGSSHLYAFDTSKEDQERDARMRAAHEAKDIETFQRMRIELGYDDAWLTLALEYGLTPGQVQWGMKKCRSEYEGDIQLFLRNYPVSPHSAFDQSTRHFFPVEATRAWRQTERPAEAVVGSQLFRDPDKTGPASIRIQATGDAWHLYRLPREGYEYTIGVDIASGTGGDYSAICVFCRNTREQVAEFYSNRMDPLDLAQQIGHAATYYGGTRCWICPESTDIGLSTIDWLLRNGFGKQLYRNAEVPDTVVNPINWTKAYGYPNRQKGQRKQLLSMLRLETIGGLQVYSPRLLHESNTFVETETDHWEHQKHCHSDAIFALALAVWCHSQMPAVAIQQVPGDPRNIYEIASIASLAHAGLLPPMPGFKPNIKKPYNALAKVRRGVPKYR